MLYRVHGSRKMSDAMKRRGMKDLVENATDPDFPATAARFERRLAAATDVRGAVQAICGPAPPPPLRRRGDAKAEARYYDLKSIESVVVCRGLPEAVRAATPTLVQLLGAPHPPVHIPEHPHHSASASWDVAFRVLSFGGADRGVAEKPVAAFLAHDASAPLAALAIARMGGELDQLQDVIKKGKLLIIEVIYGGGPLVLPNGERTKGILRSDGPQSIRTDIRQHEQQRASSLVAGSFGSVALDQKTRQNC